MRYGPLLMSFAAALSIGPSLAAPVGENSAGERPGKTRHVAQGSPSVKGRTGPSDIGVMPKKNGNTEHAGPVSPGQPLVFQPKPTPKPGIRREFGNERQMLYERSR